MLSKADILGAADLHITKVHVPQWGGEVYVRAFSLDDQLELEARKDNADVNNVLVNMVAMSLCDAEGNRLFTTDADIAAMKAKSARVLIQLSAVVSEINAISKADVAQIVKNGEAAPSAATSASLPNG